MSLASGWLYACKERVRSALAGDALVHEKCGDRAPYTRDVWPSEYDDQPTRIEVCDEHALAALEDGKPVWGPFGHPCRIDPDGEIHEEQP